MKKLLCLILILAMAVSIAGCSRTKRIINDVDWVVFDGEPSDDN